MWLASVSRRLDGICHPARDYSAAERREAYQVLRKTLHGVGDTRWGRHFRMCITQCLHRGLSDAEIAALPPGWQVEVFWSRGVPEGLLSADPCHAPRKHVVDARRDLYIPLDCGACPPCRARIEVEARGCAGGACAAGPDGDR